MSDIIKLLLQAEIGKSSIESIKAQLDNLQKTIKPIKIELDVDSKSLKNIEELNKSLSTIGTSNMQKVDMSQIDKGMRSATQSTAEYNKTLHELIHLYKTQQIGAKDFVDMASKYRQETEFKNLSDKQQLQLVQQLTKADREHTRALDEKTKVTGRLANSQEKLELFQQKMSKDLDIFANKNKGKFDETQLEAMRSKLEGLSVAGGGAERSMKELRTEFGHMKQEASQSNTMLAQITENFVKFARFYLVGQQIVNFRNAVKDGVNSVKELDTSLTELNKISNMSEQQMKLFVDRAYDAGVTIARTGKEVVDATVEWRRAGYVMEEAFELAQKSLLLTNVGSGINDVVEASSSMIAILKGFKMEAEDAIHIVDALNEVSNNYAVDTVNLTEILKRVSGTMAQTGTSYEQLIGLSVGAFESLRNSEKVASGLNMITQRLKGMSESGEEIEGLIPKIQSAFDKYTDGAVQVIDKQNGGLNSTYEILSQLQKVYPSLTDEAKAYLNEAVAGNRKQKGGFAQKCA